MKEQVNLEGYSITNGAAKKAAKTVISIAEKLVSKLTELYQDEKYSSINSTSSSLKSSLSDYIAAGNTPGIKSTFACPVNVSVYDSTGTEVGYVGEDDIWYNDDLYIEEVGDAKIVYTPSEKSYTFNVVGTDTGTMSCSFEEYNTSGTTLGRLNYYDIAIKEGTTVTVTTPASDLISKNSSMKINVDEKEVSPSASMTASNYKAVTISATAETGGTAYCAGTYTVGDAVNLIALPDSGYKFSGWYDSNGTLVTTKHSYEFMARSNASYTARFVKSNSSTETETTETATSTATTTESTSITFTDVPTSAYFYNAVQWAVENGITTGTTVTTFSPYANCTRAQTVTFLYRANGSPAVSGSRGFTDVSSDAFFAKAVQWAVANSITTGTGDGTTFSPYDACTRAQILTFLYRANN